MQRIDISIELTVCFAVSQSVCNFNKHQTFRLRQQTIVESQHFEKTDKIVSAFDDLSIECSSSDHRQNRQCI